MQRGVVDTGPIVALQNRRDRWHAGSLAFFDGFSGVAHTTWAVITEAWHLLPDHRRGSLLPWLQAGGVRVAHVPENRLREIDTLLKRYVDRPMDVADATLIWLAEQERLADIVSIEGGFESYRTASGERFVNHLR